MIFAVNPVFEALEWHRLFRILLEFTFSHEIEYATGFTQWMLDAHDLIFSRKSSLLFSSSYGLNFCYPVFSQKQKFPCR